MGLHFRLTAVNQTCLGKVRTRLVLLLIIRQWRNSSQWSEEPPPLATNQSLNNKTMRFPWQNNEWWYRYLESDLEKSFTHISTTYMKVMIFMHLVFSIPGQNNWWYFSSLVMTDNFSIDKKHFQFSNWDLLVNGRVDRKVKTEKL